MPEFDSSVVYKEITRYPGYFAGSDGSVWSNRRGKWIEMKQNRRNRYFSLNVMVSMVRKKVDVHRLILLVFSGECPDGCLARHLDGDRRNNSAANLQWGTPAENAADRVRHGTGSAKLKRNDVLEIFRLRRLGLTLEEIAKKFPVSDSQTSRILQGSAWKHLGIETS